MLATSPSAVDHIASLLTMFIGMLTIVLHCGIMLVVILHVSSYWFMFRAWFFRLLHVGPFRMVCEHVASCFGWPCWIARGSPPSQNAASAMWRAQTWSWVLLGHRVSHLGAILTRAPQRCTVAEMPVLCSQLTRGEMKVLLILEF